MVYHFQSTVSTKAEVRFHVQTAEWIPEDVRKKILEKVCFHILWVKKYVWLVDVNFIHFYSCITVNRKYSYSLCRLFFFNFLIFTPHFDVAVQNKTRITKAGELLVTSELSRSQQRNLSDCIQKISAIIAEASEKPHEPTAEDIALRAARYCLEWRYLVVDLL